MHEVRWLAIFDVMLVAAACTLSGGTISRSNCTNSS
jgi:hypothetical protein